MAANGNVELVWIAVKRLDLADDGELDSEEILKEIAFPPDVSSESLKNILKTAFELDDNLVLKVPVQSTLRNQRKSLIPINSKIAQNGNNRKYFLEVTNAHQHIKPLPKTVKLREQPETLSATFNSIINRVEAMENFMPELYNKRNAKIESEMSDLGKQLKFLNQRFTEAENSHWEGMFKKNPLW
ncbi:hypothetical protein CAPTEDRAFT_190604 [Capitella teleta]|uniref:EF-hand domain-containing protein n=1 Tax=Capitella teleta TaxID=283909 RepID=R7UAI8_CAPTE|nr:hypothetical protein CAPTEDRAFT_190604 [Capitella teleta]|eukprot:ELU03370.1 hypothetical protein CAPTEDRAFT_190604 [Capitella teleta]